jgi:hypothetical protein
MARFKKPVTTPVTAVVAEVDTKQKARIVRPGTVDDGVRKAKQLKPGWKVRAWLHNKPCGGERVVKSVEKVGDGATVLITWSSNHEPAEYKAAYRFHVAELVREPGFVPYEEV